MTPQEKELLLKDLCGRLPYKVKGQAVSNGEIYRISSIISVSPSGESLLMLDDNNIDFVTLEQTKPYLRPMSSMTEKEKKEFKDTFNGFFQYFNHGIISDSRVWDRNEAVFVGELSCSRLIDWLNAHHFDYRGLISMGLALEAKEGMYD